MRWVVIGLLIAAAGFGIWGGCIMHQANQSPDEQLGALIPWCIAAALVAIDVVAVAIWIIRGLIH